MELATLLPTMLISKGESEDLCIEDVAHVFTSDYILFSEFSLLLILLSLPLKFPVIVISF